MGVFCFDCFMKVLPLFPPSKAVFLKALEFFLIALFKRMFLLRHLQHVELYKLDKIVDSQLVPLMIIGCHFL